MANVLLLFSQSLLDDLAARPGRTKIDKAKAAEPRNALHRTLGRLSRDMERTPSTAHLRADLLEEPLDIRHAYKPDSLSRLLSNFGALVRVPRGSAYRDSDPEGHVARFRFHQLGWGVLTGYLESVGPPTMVFLRAMEEGELVRRFEEVRADTAVFDAVFSDAKGVAEDVA